MGITPLIAVLLFISRGAKLFLYYYAKSIILKFE